MILPNAFLVAEKNTSINSITSFIVKQDRKLAQSIQHICDIQTNVSSVVLKEPICYKAEWHKWILMSLIECPPAFKPVGILLLIPYYRQLLYLAADLFALKCKNHIRGTLKETNITFPACPALAMKQTYELLLHLAPAIRTDTLACAHNASLELCKDFFSSHTTGQQLLQHILGFAFLGFLCCLCFNSSLLCFSLRQIFSRSL